MTMIPTAFPEVKFIWMTSISILILHLPVLVIAEFHVRGNDVCINAKSALLFLFPAAPHRYQSHTVPEFLIIWQVFSVRNVGVSVSNPKEFFCGAGIQCSIGDLSLLGQILSALYRRHHPLHRQEGSQVCSVWRDDDEGEEPPDTSNNPARKRAENWQHNSSWRLYVQKGAWANSQHFLANCAQSKAGIYKSCDFHTIQMTYIASHSFCTQHTSFHHACRA